MRKKFFSRVLSFALTLVMLASLCTLGMTVSAEDNKDELFSDGAFKVLFIGNSASDDATDSGYQSDSKTWEIMKNMVGEDVDIELGLCWSGGKTMAWHATVALTGEASYTFMVNTDNKWKNIGTVNSETALKYTDWDAVVIQPWGLEMTRGKATFSNGEYDDFVNLSDSVPYMLDHVATNAPSADIYFYQIWATTKNYTELNAERETYDTICKYTRLAETYKGTETGATFKGVIPAGATVQALRTTYLGLLDVNNDADVIDHTTDPNMGIQRDAVHMSFCIGRYAVGLTFAEGLIPVEARAEYYELPELRSSAVAGDMPFEYQEMITEAVAMAYDSMDADEKYDVAPLEGYEYSPISTITAGLEDYYYTVPAENDVAGLEKSWEYVLFYGTAYDIVGDVTVTGSYTPPADGKYTELTGTVNFRHGYLTGSANIKGMAVGKVNVTFKANEGGEFFFNDEIVTPGADGSTFKFRGGDIAVVVPVPNFGYKVKSFKVNGQELEDELFYMDIVSENLEFEAEFEKIVLPFKDVKAKAWYYDDVMYVYSGDLMNGTFETVFEPDTPMTRAMLVTVLWRMSGSPVSVTETPFTDLKHSWYKEAVAWAYENNIVNGITETTFEPDTKVIREQTAAIFYRYAEYCGYDVTTGVETPDLPDFGKVRAYAKDAAAWAYSAGLITGNSKPSGVVFDPRGSATRAQVAAIIHRFCELEIF